MVTLTYEISTNLNELIIETFHIETIYYIILNEQFIENNFALEIDIILDPMRLCFAKTIIAAGVIDVVFLPHLNPIIIEGDTTETIIATFGEMLP